MVTSELDGSTSPSSDTERPGAPWVTWGQFVETRLLSDLRSSVPMIKALHYRPGTGTREVVTV
jgi:hypothetical protein